MNASSMNKSKLLQSNATTVMFSATPSKLMESHVYGLDKSNASMGSKSKKSSLKESANSVQKSMQSAISSPTNGSNAMQSPISSPMNGSNKESKHSIASGVSKSNRSIMDSQVVQSQLMDSQVNKSMGQSQASGKSKSTIAKSNASAIQQSQQSKPSSRRSLAE